MDEGNLQAMIARAQAGDPEAFDAVYRQFRDRVYGLCRRLLRSEHGAEDATADVFVRVHRSLASYDRERPFAPWLLTIASNTCLNRLRRGQLESRLFARPEPENHPEPSSDDPSPLTQLIASEQRQVVRERLEALPEKYRIPLLLRFGSEMSYDEIATALGTSRNNVGVLLLRGKKLLRAALSQAREATVS